MFYYIKLQDWIFEEWLDCVVGNVIPHSHAEFPNQEPICIGAITKRIIHFCCAGTASEGSAISK